MKALHETATEAAVISLAAATNATGAEASTTTLFTTAAATTAVNGQINSCGVNYMLRSLKLGCKNKLITSTHSLAAERTTPNDTKYVSSINENHKKQLQQQLVNEAITTTIGAATTATTATEASTITAAMWPQTF